MNRREILEKELEEIQKRLDNAPADMPKEIRNRWIQEYDSISFELNNLYDDPETESE